MQEDSQWYVKTDDGKIFGPIALEALVGWAREGRIASTAMISQDRQNWTLASAKSELDMTWLIEISPRQFYGPMPAAALDGLVAAGKLSANARRYHLDRGENASQLKRLQDEVNAKAAALEVLQKRFAETSETTQKTVQALEARLAKLHAESEKSSDDAQKRLAAVEQDKAVLKQDLDRRDNELAALRASIEVAEEKVRSAEDRAQAAEAALASQTAIFDAERRTMESERSTLKSAQNSLQSEMDRSEKSTASLRKRIVELEAELAEVKAGNAAQPQVVEAVVVEDEPPPMASPSPASSAASLAELEAQARRELERMGSRGRMFFGHK